MFIVRIAADVSDSCKPYAVNVVIILTANVFVFVFQNMFKICGYCSIDNGKLITVSLL